MSVSISEVLEDAGFDIKNNKHDALWLLSQANEFDEMLDNAEDCINKLEDEDDE